MNENEKALSQDFLKAVEDGDKSGSSIKVLVGLDGFVDEIVHVVDKRQDAENYTRIPTIKDYADRIASFSEKSGNIEFVTRLTKIGGNGPIMANAINTLGTSTIYIGNLGVPELDPVFAGMGEKMKVYSLATACHTDAVEFNDAKIMVGKMTPLVEVTWDRILDVVGFDNIVSLMNDADLLALVNWTMIPYMSNIYEKMIAEVFPKLDDRDDRFVFFDLADPQKREASDVEEMIGLVSQFSEKFRVIFGLNEREAMQIADILRIDTSAEPGPDRTSTVCESIKAKMGIYCVVVHPIEYAVTTIGDKTYVQEGPTTPRPKITTGAGDHFNAGFSLGQALGMDPQTSLLMGVCSSGYYVMNADSPTLEALALFMSNWREDPFGMA